MKRRLNTISFNNSLSVVSIISPIVCTDINRNIRDCQGLNGIAAIFPVLNIKEGAPGKMVETLIVCPLNYQTINILPFHIFDILNSDNATFWKGVKYRQLNGNFLVHNILLLFVSTVPKILGVVNYFFGIANPIVART